MVLASWFAECYITEGNLQSSGVLPHFSCRIDVLDEKVHLVFAAVVHEWSEFIPLPLYFKNILIDFVFRGRVSYSSG